MLGGLKNLITQQDILPKPNFPYLFALNVPIVVRCV